MSRLLFVAAPNGHTAAGQARLRVLVVPQLDGGPLAEYGLDDWPALLATVSFRVRVKTAAGIRTAWSGPQHAPAARSDVWRAFFAGPAGIAAPWSAGEPRRAEVRRQYGTAAAVTGTYRASAGELGANPSAPGRVGERIAAWGRPAAATAVPAPDPGDAQPPWPDFHQAVALLRDHPAVLRDLGLVFELAVDHTALEDGGGGAERWLAVQSRGPLPVPVTSPWSAYDLTPDAFWPAPGAPAATAARHGLLDLSAARIVAPAGPDPAAAAGAPPVWAIATFDVDAAEQGLRDAARSLAENPDRRAALPGLRSAGLQLIRPGRQADYDRRADSAQRRAGAPDEQHLTAEELTLGYRVDIRAGTESRWRSLCRRRVAYTLGRPGEPDLTLGGAARVVDEGHVKPFAAVRQSGALTADEIVLRWNGWSLVLPRPDLTGAAPPGRPADARAALPYDLRWEYAVPGDDPAVDDRLPRLRFGTDYRLRVRIADVTGGGRELDDVAGDEGASHALVYARHDPVRPPTLTGPPPPYGPGGALDRLVLRSDEGLTAEDFVAAEPRYAADLTRTLHRPAVSYEIAEQHGVFDAMHDAASWDLARRALDPAGLPDPAANGVHAHLPVADGGLDEETGDFSVWRDWPDPAPKTVVLQEQTNPAGPRISMRWEPDRLVVRLAKGERAELELSSRIDPDLQEDLVWYQWLAEDHVPFADSLNGRNPVMTPPRVVELVHAVRKPLADPVWSLPAAKVGRAEHATTAQLQPTFTALDTDSTGRIEVTAGWTEPGDGAPVPVAGRVVHAQALDRGAPPEPLIRHEFGDTRHRLVRYTLRAVSRYRHEFHADEPDAAFERVREQAEPVNIRSSARPPAAQILTAGPSLHWRTETRPGAIERVRTGRVRVEVGRPWYRTGEGERLAVIAAVVPPPPGAPGPLESELSRDPVLATAAPVRFPPAAAFAAAAAGPAIVLPAAELGRAVAVVPYAVHPAAGCWFADVSVDDGTYRPFARLAVARYQPDSLDGLFLSPTETTDLVPLLPPRRVTVERAAGGVRVTVTGPGPSQPNPVAITVETGGAAAADLIALGGDGRPDAWRPAGPPVTVPVGATATVALPAGPDRVRLRIRETEPLAAADGAAGPPELTGLTALLDVIEIPADWRP
ncbi:hypothetical protein [Dactylosporangium sp. CA-092794]|uniref:hypothetical protein n=1 Tax=Dactylosporangium sp. CA-092794 TaxID=3239929 RepID=UPI003D8B164C